jgi:probable phosphoglycerate mutase
VALVTRLVLIRHGESTSTVARRIGGHRTCSGLSPLGLRQAEALRDRLEASEELSADVLITSLFRRAQQTAEIIAPALGLPVLVDPAVGEHDPGPDCDGMTFAAFTAAYGRVDWELNPYLSGFPGGETLADFQHRVASAIHRIADLHEGRAVVLVCHGGVIDVALRVFLRAPLVGDFELHTLNTSLTEVEHTARRRWRLIRYNDITHLRGLPVETPSSP